MAEDGLVIPKQTSLTTIMENLKSTMTELGVNFEEYTKQRERQIAKQQEVETSQNKKVNEYYKKQQEFQENVKNDRVYQYLSRIFPEKHQKKLNKIYEKSLIKNKYFQFSMKALMSIDKAVNNNAGWIVSLLGMLALLAIFDPNGSFITMVVDSIVKGILWLADFILPLIPQLITTMFNLIPIIVNKLAAIIPTLLKGIGKALFDAGKNAGGFFGAMLKFVSFLISNDAVVTLLQGFVQGLKYLIPVLLSLAVLGKVFGFLSIVIPKIVTAFSVLSKIAMLLGISVGWVVLAIVGLIAVLYFTIKYWDKIKEFFGKVGEMIVNFFMVMLPNFFKKWWPVLLGMIFGPIGAVIGYIGMKIYENWDSISKWFLKMWDTIIEKLKGYGKSIKKFLSNLWSSIKKFFSWENIKQIFKDGWKTFRAFIDDIWKAIKSPFVKLKDFLKGLFLWISSFVRNPFKSISFEQAQGITALSSKTGLSQGRLEEITKSKGRIELTKREIEDIKSKDKDFNQAELMKQLYALQSGDDAKLAQIMKSIDDKITPEIGGTPQIRGSVE